MFSLSQLQTTHCCGLFSSPRHNRHDDSIYLTQSGLGEEVGLQHCAASKDGVYTPPALVPWHLSSSQIHDVSHLR